MARSVEHFFFFFQVKNCVNSVNILKIEMFVQICVHAPRVFLYLYCYLLDGARRQVDENDEKGLITSSDSKSLQNYLNGMLWAQVVHKFVAKRRRLHFIVAFIYQGLRNCDVEVKDGGDKACIYDSHVLRVSGLQICQTLLSLFKFVSRKAL